MQIGGSDADVIIKAQEQKNEDAFSDTDYTVDDEFYQNEIPFLNPKSQLYLKDNMKSSLDHNHNFREMLNRKK